MSQSADQGTGAGSGTAVAVTGVGLVTPAGADEHSFWEGLCAGHSTARRRPELAGLPVDFACAADDIDLDAAVGGRSVWRMARFVKLAVVAARQAVADAGLDPAVWDGGRVGVVLGVGVGGVSVLVDNAARLAASGPDAVSPLLVPMMIPNAAAGEVAIALKAGGPSLAPATACASGATAVAVARDLLLGGSDVVVAGGSESVLTPLVVTAFARMGALSTRTDDPAGASRPFAADRDGFVIGEGAAMLVLERAEAARARGGRARALLTGAGSSTDAHHPTAPAPDGRGAERAVRAALDQSGWAAGEVDHINAHGTSTPLNDAMETTLISRLFPHRPPVTAPKGVVGHTLAAAGAIEAVATVLTLERSLVPPIANLDSLPDAFPLDCAVKEPRHQRVERAVSHSFGFGGHNVALAFQRA